jgi:hypothetical protein
LLQDSNDHFAGCLLFDITLQDVTLELETAIALPPALLSMCKVHNTIGSLTAIKKHLLQNYVTGFNSVKELLSFQKNYDTSRQQIVSTQTMLLTEERNNLNIRIVELEHELERDKLERKQKFTAEIETLRQQYNALAEAEKTFIQEFTYSFKALFKLIRITYLESISNSTITRAVRPQVELLDTKRKRYQYLLSYFEEAVTESGRGALNDLDHTKRVIDEINSYIYGAIGEQKVVEELKQLPDEYILINDFTLTFDKPIFYSQERSYIKSVQIDHLLISPAGIFLIETKNWSKESLKNINLRSPVAQIKRTNYALYKLLSGKLGKHQWGERKIPVKNLIVLINHKPTEEFQYVKILTLPELVGYVKYFQPSLSNQEMNKISDYLLSVSDTV